MVSVAALAIWTYCEISRIFRRSVRSATTPPMSGKEEDRNPRQELVESRAETTNGSSGR